MQQYYVRQQIRPTDRRDDLAYVFDAIALIATAGLVAYIHLVRDLGTAIREPTFEQKLRKRAERRQETQSKEILAIVNAASASASVFGDQPI
jgi:hypothetical protein